jgi:hypothetical protein
MIVSHAQLEAIAAMFVEEAARSTASRNNGNGAGIGKFDVEGFLAKHSISIKRIESYQGGRRIILQQCVFDADHKGTGAAIIERETGALGYKCQHNSCSDKTWADLRKLLDPDYQGTNKGGIYRATPRGLVRVRTVDGAQIEIPLTNFVARIVGNVTHDDGEETSQHFEIEITQNERTIKKTIPADKYASMRWPIEALGSRAIIYAGQGTTDHARAAIQVLSPDPVTRTVYTHTGWRELSDKWTYLHGAGAIDADGEITHMEVSLPPSLKHFKLELPPTDEDLRIAVHASLRVLELAPYRVTVPVYGAWARVLLGEADFAEYLYGATGRFKTELAVLMQQHFGAGFISKHLPASFTNTVNVNEALAFIMKDALLLVDEFNPPAASGGRGFAQEQMVRDAVRLFRSQGNNVGRGRMRSDTTLRSPKLPRGLVLATGENDFPGESLNVRVPTIEIFEGDVDVSKLTVCQADAAAGLYVQATAGFIHYLARDLDGFRAEFKRLEKQFRLQFHNGHPRTSDIQAQLRAAYAILAGFLIEIGAMDEAEATALNTRVRVALAGLAADQAAVTEANEPTATYLRLLRAALTAGKAHLADMEGDAPRGHELACGWRHEAYGQIEKTWRPQGDRIGWTDGTELYLNRDASYRVAQAMAGSGSPGIEVSVKTLSKRLHEKHLLRAVEEIQGTLTVRVTIAGHRELGVLHLAASTLFEIDDASGAKNGTDR